LFLSFFFAVVSGVAPAAGPSAPEFWAGGGVPAPPFFPPDELIVSCPLPRF
jgi:hypothetical protein